MQKSVVRRFYVPLPSHPFPCYNWLRKDEGRIFRDRSGGKLTTWIPRGVCQLYPYFSVGNSRSHLRGRGWGVRCASDSRGSHTRLAKTGHGRRSKSSLSTKRNANTRRRRRRRGYERAAFQNATRFKINRSVDSCYYFSLSLPIFLFSASLFSTSTREHVFFYNINIDDETDYFAVSLNKKYLKKIFRYWFLFFFDPSEKWEGNIPDLYIFTNNREKMFVFTISPYKSETFYYSEQYSKKESCCWSFYFFYKAFYIAASKFTITIILLHP